MKVCDPRVESVPVCRVLVSRVDKLVPLDAATSADPDISQCKCQLGKRTVAKTEDYARLQINSNGILFPFFPMFAEEKAICIGLSSS